MSEFRLPIPASLMNWKRNKSRMLSCPSLFSQFKSIDNRLTREGSGRSDAMYRDTRKSLQRLESRIAFLTSRLAITEEIDPLDQDGDKVRFGAAVSVQELEIVKVRYPRR